MQNHGRHSVSVFPNPTSILNSNSVAPLSEFFLMKSGKTVASSNLMFEVWNDLFLRYFRLRDSGSGSPPYLQNYAITYKGACHHLYIYISVGSHNPRSRDELPEVFLKRSPKPKVSKNELTNSGSHLYRWQIDNIGYLYKVFFCPLFFLVVFLFGRFFSKLFFCPFFFCPFSFCPSAPFFQ